MLEADLAFSLFASSPENLLETDSSPRGLEVMSRMLDMVFPCISDELTGALGGRESTMPFLCALYEKLLPSRKL
ncbi:hypothetical protein D3C78_1501000 [compost metagenome]